MKFLQNIFLLILSIQEKILTKKLNRTLGARALTIRKKHFQEGCLLTLDSVAESEKNKMEEELMLILKSSNYNPKEVLEYIKKHNTNVYFINNEKSLKTVGENFGFIYPQKGLKALYISLLTQKRFSIKTNAMFILGNGNINTYFFIYHFYNWYTFKHGIFGIDREARDLLEKFLLNSSDDNISRLQLADIYKLKEAIKQDKSAIEFVVKLCQKYETTQNALQKIKDNGASI